jgi:hypothetical protein
MMDRPRIIVIAGRYAQGRGALVDVNSVGIALVALDDYPGVLKAVRFDDLTDEEA